MPAGENRLQQNFLLFVGLFCFFFSGVAGLIYEVVWMRMLTQIFGNTTYAIATVLASFMAGLALGSYLFGKIADRGKNDFLLYGLLEAGVGIYGLLVPWLFKLGYVLYAPLYGLNESFPFLFNLMLFFLSFVLLVFPTMLMGATLPVLSRFFVRSLTHLGRRVGDLYATNTLGAVIGCAAAGYFLIPNYGMRATIFVAAGLNLVIAVLIFAIDKLRDKSPLELEAVSGEAVTREGPSWLGWALLFSFGLSGFSALVYENAWTRALTLVLGSSVYSFTTMLVTFLVGLALGGFFYARLLGEKDARVSTFGLVEFLIGVSALATIPLFEKLPLIFLRLLDGFGESFALFLTFQLVLSAVVMFLPTLFFGMTFPLVARLFTQSIYRVGTSVGTSYAANTLGAILGAFAGGFILIPLIGVQNTIIFGVVINLVIGWFLVVVDPRYSLAPRAALGVAVLVAAVLIPLRTPRWDPYVLTSGVTIYNERYEDLPLDSLRLEDMHRDEMLYYKEGLTATISVQRIGKDYIYWKTNGKIDGSHGDALTQLMSGYIGIFMNPNAKRAAVIGLGTGMTTSAIAAFPLIEEIEVLEIEPAMIEAAAFFNDKNGRILEDPRVRIIATDGRNHILATAKKYDVISAEPSNPWIAGIANLYTREFYEVIKSKLADGGVFAQWVHNYSMSPDDFRMVFRTFGEAFPYVTVWCMKESDFLMVGSLQEQVFNYPLLQQIYANSEKIRSDFRDLGLSDIYSVLGFYRMGKKELLAFSEGAEINTDDGAQLEYSAPKSLRRATSMLNRKIMEPFEVTAPWLDAKSIPVPQALRHFYLAQAYQGSSWTPRALEEVDKAIQLDPVNPEFYVLKAKLFLEQEKSAEAAQAALAALNLSPKTIPAVLQISDEFYLQEAKTVYMKTIELGTREVLPYLGLGNIALHYRELDEAEKWFSRARRIKPDHPAVLLGWGRLMLARDDAARAKEFLEQARAHGEDSGTLYGALGDAYFKLELWEQAVAAYKQAFDRNRRRNVEWRRKLGIALAHMGKKREAEQKFREVLAFTPDDADAWRELRKIGVRY
ncbi:MAG TPA: fused MFS/spermidine synthase [Candidatus Acidoferrales bacterium]|nr:fused MFS/spermidine synthase [Candidatus Acidoferrales bacterium]